MGRIRLTLCGADAHPCASMKRVLPAVVSVRQTCLARGGGWARLTLAVGRLLLLQ